MAEQMQDATSFDFDGEYGKEYDYIARTVIPGYDDIFRIALSLLHEHIPQDANVLIVGAGTGKEISTFVPAEPDWRFTAVDPSEQMIQTARAVATKLQAQDRIKFHHGYTSGMPRDVAFDAATIINVMHFLPDDGSKENLVNSVAQRVRSGGSIVLLDLHGDPATEAFTVLKSAWEHFMERRGLTGDDKRRFLEKLSKGIVYVSEDRVLEIYRRAGLGLRARFFRGLLYGGWLFQKNR